LNALDRKLLGNVLKKTAEKFKNRTLENRKGAAPDIEAPQKM